MKNMEPKVYIPFEATHPGSILKDELDYRRIKKKNCPGYRHAKNHAERNYKRETSYHC